MEKEIPSKEIRMCMDCSVEDVEKDNHDDVATRIIKEYIKTKKEKREVENQS